MTNPNNFLDNHDVVHIKNDRFDFDKTTKLEQIKKKMNNWIRERFQKEINQSISIFPDFINNCEVLKQDGKGWRKGKIIIRFEFIPDDPEPEDDIQITDQKSLDEFRK
ncbi:hypothetical protein FRE64_05545 [Euhalothece natronophila Z-M001]|uniref:KGK family protein n=1 Tax=Euhalothece natronophila Z-M001 TaxID=522448 RepID=A0A5B8NJF0_9CHRO|nr:KGK domain-containing protein [Euhalothece natronophila]QDZ39433.1 hypothetical protein FRE64_05545 [Euhalothece natronophila Z-M001]